MPQPPVRPKIYHIVHVDRLASILTDGQLWCDAVIANSKAPGTVIGMTQIKARRLKLPVKCHQGDCVGDYVPFYFCPRSIMLYVIHRANHPELAYRGGQGPIVHLEADLHSVVTWAEADGRRWAFTLSNAGAYYTEFRSQLGELAEVNWTAVAATDFRLAEIKEGKQAEFLVQHSFPWKLVERIGVSSSGIAQQVANTLGAAAHRPAVQVLRDWYY
jgi:hypothetical protein